MLSANSLNPTYLGDMTSNIDTNNIINSLINWRFFPDPNTFGIPDLSAPIPEWPFSFKNKYLEKVVYPLTLQWYFPVAIAVIYFFSVHSLNKVALTRQITHFKERHPNEKLPSNLKKLKPVPYTIAKWRIFKVLVLIHNILLCVYSIWTFIGMTTTIHKISNKILPQFLDSVKSNPASKVELFWQCICNNSDADKSFWYNYAQHNLKGLTFYGYLFYLSKYYEILDTVIILLKGRPSSLLQSYHHSGAILCMWSGIRFMSSPIWIFVVFNSFIHSLMYGYFSLSCLKIRVPNWFKQSLTSLQITQFVIGGSLAVVHLFVKYYDYLSGTYNSCVATSEQALAVYMNVFYLAPLTLLFAAFYVESYKNKRLSLSKKNI